MHIFIYDPTFMTTHIHISIHVFQEDIDINRTGYSIALCTYIT